VSGSSHKSVETTSLFLKNKVKPGETQIKYASCFKQSEHRIDLSFVPESNVKFVRKEKKYCPSAYKHGSSLWGFQHLSIQV